jgi:hypothetical protein
MCDHLQGKITKCATAGSFDDTDAVKQTRDLELVVVMDEALGSECGRNRRGE